MPNDSHIKDPQKIWQSQPTEPFKTSARSLRAKAQARHSRSRFEAQVPIVIGISCSVFFAWTCTKAHTELARAGWGILSLWGIFAACYAYVVLWPKDLPEDAPIGTCLEFYRRELERRRDHVRNSWLRMGLPVALVGMLMVILGTGAQNAPPTPLRNALPFLSILALWFLAYFTIMKKLGRENIEKELEELRSFETENRS